MVNQKIKQSNLWEEYWTDSQNHDYWKKPESTVVDFVSRVSNTGYQTLFDLGCGLGRHSIYCSKLGFSVFSIDNSIEAIKFLEKWAQKEGCAINTKCGDLYDESLNSKCFDIVISYNVIYHGFQTDFLKAIRRIYELMNNGGMVFFTCPTRNDGKFGIGEKVGTNTYKCIKSITPGDIHYFTDQGEIKNSMKHFRKVEIVKDEGFWNNSGVEQVYSNFIVIAQK